MHGMTCMRPPSRSLTVDMEELIQNGICNPHVPCLPVFYLRRNKLELINIYGLLTMSSHDDCMT